MAFTLPTTGTNPEIADKAGLEDALNIEFGTKSLKCESFLSISTGGTADAMTAPAVPGMTAYANGQTFAVTSFGINSSTSPTLNIGGLGALPIKDEGGNALKAGDLLGGRIYGVRVSGAADEFRLIFRGYNKPLIDGLAGKSDLVQPIPSVSSSGGTANAQQAPAPSWMTSLVSGMQVVWYPNATNTAPDPTLAFGALGPSTLKNASGGALAAGDIKSLRFYILRYVVTGNIWRVISSGMVDSEITAKTNATISEKGRLRDLDPIYRNMLPAFDLPVSGTAATVEVSSNGTPLFCTAPGVGVYWNNARISRSEIAGDQFNCGITIFEAGSSASRFLVLQVLGDGSTEIAGTRTTFQAAGEITQDAPVSYEALSVPIHAECQYIRLYQDGTLGTKTGLMWLHPKHSKFSSPVALSAGRVVYLDPDGDDGDAGTSGLPKATMAAAMSAGATKVILRDGLYDAAAMTLSGSSFSGLDILADTDALPIIRGGHACTGFTAVSGRTNVYQAACTVEPRLNDPTTPKGFVWVLGEPWGLIDIADRHPCHQGRSHRAPHYPLYAGPTGLDALEAAPTASWYWASDVLYVNAPAGVDPSTMVVQVPSGDATSNRNRANSLAVMGVVWEFVGLTLDDMASFDLEGVTVTGAPFDAYSLDRVSGTHRFCASIGPSNDGFNLHGTIGDTPGRQDGYAKIDVFEHSIDAWSCLAWDDCRSAHERMRCRVDGGLLEFGGSTGSAPANGAEETMYHTEIRSCGWDGNEKSGVAMVNMVSDDGTGCVFEGHGVIVKDTPRGFYCGAGAAHRMNLWDTHSRDLTEHIFYTSTAGATINVNRHHDSGSAATSTGGGTVNVSNGTLIP